MAMDVVHVLKKGRHDFKGLKTSLVAERAEDEPRRFTSVAMHFTVAGNVPPEPVQRAIDLSRDKVLFGLELAATGHRAEGDVHGRGRLTTDHGRNAVTPRLPGSAARPGGPHHDRGPRPRQLDTLPRSPDAPVRLCHGARRLRRAALSLPGRRRGAPLGRVEVPTDGRPGCGRSRPSAGAASKCSDLPSSSGFRRGCSAGLRSGRILKVDILNIMGPVDHGRGRDVGRAARR